MLQSRNLSGCQIFSQSQMPSEWVCVPLKDRIELLYGRALKKDIRKMGAVDVFGSNGKVGSHNVSWLDGPGVLVGRKGTVGAVHYSEKPYWPIDTVYYVKTIHNDQLRYLYYLLDYLPLKSLNAATGVPGLSRRDVYALRGAFPPTAEQAPITQVLDAVNTAIWLTQEIINRVGDLRRALMQELLPPWIGFKHFDANRTLEGVESIELASDVCDVCNGSTPSRTEGRYWRNGTIAWLPTGMVHQRTITHANQFVTELALKECSINLLPSGTVLIGMIGQGRTRGMAAYLDMKACINQNFGAFVPRQKVLGKWLFHFFDFHYNRLREIGGGTNQGALNCYMLKRLRLPLPPIDRQEDVSAILDEVERLERSYRLSLQHREQLKKSLMHDLLTGTVRVDPILFKNEEEPP
ncbi:MAG: restriction endonuclease subunit S [Pseudomonadota bacterium]